MPLSENWNTSSGLLENENVWVESSNFAYDADYNKGQTCCCVLNVKCDDGRVEKILLACGEGWEPAPGGTEMRREDGNTTKQVQKNSAYGAWVESIKAIAGVNAGLMQVLESRPGGSKSASTWVGMGLHVIRHEDKFTINGEERSRQTLLADAFLGMIGAPSAPAAQVAPQAAVAQPVAAPGAPVGVIAPPPVGAASNGHDPAVMATLTALAKAAADHNTFMVQAFSVPGVMGNGELETGITDQSDAGLYVKLKNS